MTDQVKDIYTRMLGTKELPDKLVKLYERTKFLSDRIAPGPMPVSTMALVAIIAGAAKTEEVSSDTASPKTNKWDSVKKDTPVTTFLDGASRGGIFLGVCGNKNKGMLRIKIDGDSENFREIAQSEVKLKE
ncbi:MAG: hypothetical protein A2Y07_01275 [Planctomycetes bacterium GWF2_50_10]|nr:MAG: hypothetical protein A2Y07_01275 [Planctomycetes bacterium GWF2_50_10]